MLNVESKSLVPYIPEQRSLTSVNSGEFTRYLHTKNVATEAECPDRIDLGWYTQAMEYLYTHSEDAFHLSEEDRKKWLKEIESRKETDTDIEVIRQSRERQKALVNQKDKGERGYTVYLDYEDNQIKVSNVTHGDQKTVKTDYFQLINEDKLPLFGIHTHPTNTLFSPQDYRTLILNIGNDDRIVKSELLLCPNYQILMLATDKTPSKDPENTDSLIGIWIKQISEAGQGRFTTLANRYSRVEKFVGKFSNKSFSIIMATIAGIEDRMKLGEITKEEALQLVDKEIIKYQEKMCQMKEKYGRIADKTLKQRDNYANQKTNEILMELAYAMGVKLYISTDMQNFVAFSA